MALREKDTLYATTKRAISIRAWEIDGAFAKPFHSSCAYETNTKIEKTWQISIPTTIPSIISMPP